MKVDTLGPISSRPVSAIAAGDDHSLALADGKVYSWGWNSSGQLGDNSVTDSSVPVAVDTSGPLSGLFVTEIAAGFTSSYALTSTGRLFAWGDNRDGQLGLGTVSSSFLTPQEVLAPSGFIWTGIGGSSGTFAVATVAAVPEPGAVVGLVSAAGLWLGAFVRRRIRRKMSPVESSSASNARLKSGL